MTVSDAQPPIWTPSTPGGMAGWTGESNGLLSIDATAPLPPHMQQSWSLLGFDAARYDPIEDAPEG